MIRNTVIGMKNTVKSHRNQRKLNVKQEILRVLGTQELTMPAGGISGGVSLPHTTTKLSADIGCCTF
jgi:hypothetical protein